MTQPSEIPPRNHVAGLAFRARKNLDYIVEARARGENVHVVTQTVTSLVALVVIPFERALKGRLQGGPTLEYLNSLGWPLWTLLDGNPTPRLFAMIAHLRHAVSHSTITFSSDSQVPAEVMIEFTNFKVPPYLGGGMWRAQIQGDELLSWCRLYSEWLVDELDKPGAT